MERSECEGMRGTANKKYQPNQAIYYKPRMGSLKNHCLIVQLFGRKTWKIYWCRKY